MRFAKITATGNDFIGLWPKDARNLDLPGFARRHCPRGTAVGADGVVVPELIGSNKLAFTYYNYMGQKVPFCGNAVRALAWFAKKAGLIDTDKPVVVAGQKEYQVFLSEDQAGVELDFRLLEPDPQHPDITRLHLGVEHGVVFVSGLKKLNILGLKNKLGNPKINLNFAEMSQEGLFVRSLELGYPVEPLSCATGAASAGVAYCLQNGLEQVKITTRGGPLLVEMVSNNRVQLWGPLSLVYIGWLYGSMEI